MSAEDSSVGESGGGEVLLPDCEICDPHHHLWDRPESRYLLAELHQDTGCGHRVTETVFIECMSAYRESGPEEERPVGETEWVRKIAEASEAGDGATIAGIVSFANLLLGDEAGRILDLHREVGGERFKGIRHAAGWDQSDAVRNSHTSPPHGLFLDPTFRRGFGELGRRGLTFEAWHYHHQLPELIDLARAFPDQPIVLDHFGGPLGIGPYEGRRREIFERWRQDVSTLAECPAVFAKLGGMAMPINGFGWHKRDRRATADELIEAQSRYYETVIEAFGPDRCMFESNFPVDRVSISYFELWNAFKRLAMPYTDDERQQMFRGTARRFYGL